MDDPFTVRLIERVRNLNSVFESLVEGERAFSQQVRKRLTFDVLHHDEIQAVLSTDIVEGTDVRMVQARDGPRLALESLAERGVT